MVDDPMRKWARPNVSHNAWAVFALALVLVTFVLVAHFAGTAAVAALAAAMPRILGELRRLVRR